MTDNRDAILAIVNDPEYRPVKPRGIARSLGLEGPEAEEIRKTVKRLIKEKLLKFGPNHLVMPTERGQAAGDKGQKSIDGAQQDGKTS